MRQYLKKLLLLMNLQVTLDSLESEVYSDTEAYKFENYTQMHPLPTDYDEVFDDDDGYPD